MPNGLNDFLTQIHWKISLPIFVSALVFVLLISKLSIPLKYNIRYLITRRSTTLMTALVFALVVGVFINVMSLAVGLEKAFVSTGHDLNLLVMRPGVQAEGQSSVQIDRYQTVRNLPGIAKDENGEPLAAPEVLVLVNKPRMDGKPSNLQIRGIHQLSLKMRPEIKIIEGQGRMFTPGMRELIVSQSVSKRFQGVKLGDKVQLGRGAWTVSGIFDGKGTAYDSEMWADFEELRQEFDKNAYSTVLVQAVDSAAAEALIKAVDEDARIKLSAKSEKAYYDEQTKSAGPIKFLGLFLAVMMSIGACFAGMNTMYASVANRVKEIATLRVLGFTPFSILVSFLLESIFLALLGGALGCLVSYIMNLTSERSTGTTNFQGSFSEVIFYFTITPDLLLRGIAFALIMGAVGGLLPAISAARKPILEAMRQV